MMIKICGITNAADAAAAIDAGADAIGFNFFAASPRYIAPQRAAGIPTAPGILRVGVFVNESPAEIENIARIASLNVAQLHGDRDAPPSHIEIWKAFRVDAAFTLASLDTFPASAYLLDSPGDLYGGSGRSFDWSRASGAAHRILLAGGLDSSNVAAAITAARPWGVDSCSRIESRPGIKDHVKLKLFVQAVRNL